MNFSQSTHTHTGICFYFTNSSAEPKLDGDMAAGLPSFSYPSALSQMYVQNVPDPKGETPMFSIFVQGGINYRPDFRRHFANRCNIKRQISTSENM